MKSSSQREFDATFGKNGVGVCSPDAVYVVQGPPRCLWDLNALAANTEVTSAQNSYRKCTV